MNQDPTETDEFTCDICGEPCDFYKNCRNSNCDALFVSCLKCQEKLVGCCSEKCLSEIRKTFLEKAMRNQGRKSQEPVPPTPLNLLLRSFFKTINFKINNGKLIFSLIIF